MPSILYIVQVLEPNERETRAARGFGKVRPVYDQLNEPFQQAVDTWEETRSMPTNPLPRLYISKNRTLLAEACDYKGTLAVISNTRLEPWGGSHFLLTVDVVITQPVGECSPFESDEGSDQLPHEYLPKAWAKVQIVRVQRNIQFILSHEMEKVLFRRAYTTHRVSKHLPGDLKKARDPKGELVMQAIENILTGVTAVDEAKWGALRHAPSPSAQPSAPKEKSRTGLGRKRKIANSPPEQAAQRVKSETGSPQPRDATLVGQNNRSPSSSHDTTPDKNSHTPSVSPDVHSPMVSQDEMLPSSPSKDGYDPEQQPQSDKMYTKYLAPDDETMAQPSEADGKNREYYLEEAHKLWEKVFAVCREKNVPIVNIKKYTKNTSAFPNAEGYFKHVYYVHGDNNIVVQTFRRMTITQRVIELVSLLKLRGLPRMGQIVEVLQEDGGEEIVGLSMQRYQKTLKHYTHSHSHHRLTACQKMDLVRQMLDCIRTIHAAGIAHRDLSEVNFMVNANPDRKLSDGSVGADVFLIDFGKAVFTRAEDVRQWWVDRPKVAGEYEGEVLPETQEELDAWCAELPWIKAKPDHGYRHYRSIQTLPRSRSDHNVLPWLIEPAAEDVYSLGTILWKVFAETEPWHGILDTDLRGLRDMVQDDFRIQKALEREVPGEQSRELLARLIRANPEDRSTPTNLLTWMNQQDIRMALLNEWTIHAPVGRSERHAKAAFKFEEEQAKEHPLKRSGSSSGGTGTSSGRGRRPKRIILIP